MCINCMILHQYNIYCIYTVDTLDLVKLKHTLKTQKCMNTLPIKNS